MATQSGITPRERRLAQFFFALLAALKVAYLFRFRFDSDEAQHLHVVWGWTQGLMQYRDVFDNHMPLFHLLCAPLLALFPERPDILLFMRAAMLPLFAFSLWCTWKIGSAVWSPRAGLWAAIFAGLWRGFFFCSTEFRTDELFTAAWMGALVIAVCGAWSTRRAFAFGLAMGVCAGVSQKTTLLVVTLLLAGLGVFFLVEKRRAQWSVLARRGAAFAGGFVIVPGAIAAFFVLRGAWEPFFYCVLAHNVVPGVDRKNEPIWWMLFFPLTLPFIWLGARWLARRSADVAVARRRVFVFLVATLYFALLQSYWTLITRQDYLPYHPVAFVTLAPLFLWLGEKMYAAAGAPRARAAWLAPATLCAVEIAFILLGRPLSINGTARGIELVRETLRLTGPEDRVMDFKGETIYRRRAFYYVLEPFTLVRIRRKIIPDSIPEDMVKTDTHVAVTTLDRMPNRAGKFISEHYLPVGALRVAGQIVSPTGGGAAKFKLVVPAEYAAVSEHGGAAAGLLDGLPYTGPRPLALGAHEWRAAPGAAGGRVAILWSRAAERGFSPFSAAATARPGKQR